MMDLYRKIVHTLIVRYLNSCGCAFHHGEYGPDGKYVVLMSDRKYYEYQNMQDPYR